jgi:hypothetical protein
MLALISEGESEIASLHLLFSQLADRCGISLMRPILAPVDPLAPEPLLARGISERVKLAAANGATEAVVLLDLETPSTCPVAKATSIEQRLLSVCSIPTRVVMKVVKYENWVAAAIGAIEAQPGAFPQARRVRPKAENGKADGIPDAYALLRSSSGRNGYHKVHGAKKVMSKADMEEIAANSRSFRRMLALMGDARYSESSKLFVSPGQK